MGERNKVGPILRVGRRHLNRELRDWMEVRFSRIMDAARHAPRDSRERKVSESRPRLLGPSDPAREAEICRRVMTHEPMASIGRDYGLSRQRVQQIVKRRGLTGFNPCKGCGKRCQGSDHCFKCNSKIQRWGSLERPPSKSACTCGRCAPGKQARCYMRRLYAESAERRARITANTMAWQKKVLAEGGKKAERLRQGQRDAAKRWIKRHPERVANNAKQRRERRRERYASDPEFRAAEQARMSIIRERHEERMQSDPEYAKAQREKWRAASRRAYEKKTGGQSSDTRS